jgi:DNA-binding HxlR family transcriptional regulator
MGLSLRLWRIKEPTGVRYATAGSAKNTGLGRLALPRVRHQRRLVRRRGDRSRSHRLAANHLEDMEENGLITRVDAPATGLYQLTERGQHLQPVIGALVEWGCPRCPS